MSENNLSVRRGLPDALRVLLEDHPREGWQAHPDFNGLVSFWLERHMMFRRLLAQMQQDTEAFLDRKSDPAEFAQLVARNGGLFVNQLHGHHQIEDHHYFPLLREKDPRIEAGFDLLVADHQALDGLLDGFVRQANSTIRSVSNPGALKDAALFLKGLSGLEVRIGRHLEDEEDLIVPVILKSGSEGLG